MLATQITTHAADGIARLLSQYKDRPILSALLNVLCVQAQQFEDAAFPVAAGRLLVGGNAIGKQLDKIGELVGLERQGLSDAQYRILLIGTIAQNNSRADNETLLNIVETVFSAASSSIISPFSPGHSHRLAPAVVGVEVGSPTIDASLYTLVIGILQKSIASNVNLSWVSTFDADNAFALAGPQSGMGLGDNQVPDSGGTLATLIYNNLAN